MGAVVNAINLIDHAFRVTYRFVLILEIRKFGQRSLVMCVNLIHHVILQSVSEKRMIA